MLCQIKIPFKSKKKLHYGFLASSVMQGILMENIPSFYADKMHDQNLRPYSQFTDFSDGTNIWTISSLNHEAYDNIIEPVLKLTTAKVRHNYDILTFEKPLIIFLTYEQLLAESYSSGKKTDICVLEFITPTAFKSSGSYVILPSLRLIFLSLAKRFDAFFGIGNNDYESLAVEIERSITVSYYKLSGASFSLEGIRLPSFTGNIKIRIKGDEQFISYIRMLCRFAEFSGIGIKTAIGMGQVRTV